MCTCESSIKEGIHRVQFNHGQLLYQKYLGVKIRLGNVNEILQNFVSSCIIFLDKIMCFVTLNCHNYFRLLYYEN